MSCWFNLSIWLVKKILSALVIRRYACSHWNYCSSLLAYCINMELQMAGALILVQLLIIWLQNKRIQCHDAFASDDLIIIACITTQLPSLTPLPLQSWHYCISLFWQAATQLCQHNVADRRIKWTRTSNSFCTFHQHFSLGSSTFVRVCLFPSVMYICTIPSSWHKEEGWSCVCKKSTLNTLRSFQRAAHKKYCRNPGSSEWVLKLTCQIYGTGERLGIIWTNLYYDHHLFRLCKHRNIQGKFLAAPPNLFPIDLNVHLRGSYKKLSFGSSSFWWFLAHSALAGNRLPVLQLQDPNQVYTAGFFVLKEKNKQKGTRKYEATRTLGTSTKNSNF